MASFEIAVDWLICRLISEIEADQLLGGGRPPY